MRLAFLGPAGTYGEQAAVRLAALEGSIKPELLPQVGIRAVVQALAEGRCDGAVVPVENSVEGGVTACLDALWEHPDLRVARALVLPIRHALVGSGSIEAISEVLSHPQALAQCSQWLGDHLPRALQLPTTSTAEAARMVAGSSFRGAIASCRRRASTAWRCWPIPSMMWPAIAPAFCCSTGAPVPWRGPWPAWLFHSMRTGPVPCWRPSLALPALA
jgi:prephenate dehydratase